jgi:hypothetical protein
MEQQQRGLLGVGWLSGSAVYAENLMPQKRLILPLSAPEFWAEAGFFYS